MIHRIGVCTLTVFGLFLCGGPPATATTYSPVTFDDLVARAEAIFVGDVVDVRAFSLETREGPIIKTRVVFRVIDPIFGTASALEVFDFLGGELGEIKVAVAGMPRFAVGNRIVMFTRRDRSINPIVGFSQGLLRVGRDNAGVERIFTSEGAPLASPESIGARPAAVSIAAAAMPLSQFRARVAGAVAEARRR